MALQCGLCVRSRQVDADGHKHASPAGAFADSASPHGAYDMAGNVWEWCRDWYRKDYYTSVPAKNPTGPAIGTHRVLRGGSFANAPTEAQTITRTGQKPGFSEGCIGFRIVRLVDPIFMQKPEGEAGKP